MRHSGRNEIFHNIGGVLREGVPMRSRANQEHGRHDPIRLMHRALRHPGDLSRARETYGSPSIWDALSSRDNLLASIAWPS